jgi:DNA (cytosine-5)-methyltransferase 1
MIKLRKGPWKLSELKSVPKNGRNVFSIFHCGGGSTMGYKLAGFNVLGGVEIDPQMTKIYRANHDPKYSYLMGVQDFNKILRSQHPKELLDLDILDGSPPCSSFSIAGSREDAWGEKKKFREGQTEQVLDDLFFHFIETARILQPKVVIAENVKGLVIGKARGYVKQIFQLFNVAGYDCQLFLLNAAFMGVPQRRERTFFIARRRTLKLPEIRLSFNETPISFRHIEDKNVKVTKDLQLTPTAKKYWAKCEKGKSFSSIHEKGSLFNWIKVDPAKPLNTLASGNAKLMFHHSEPRLLTDQEWIRGQTFPDDYKFLDADPRYVCGMSVPPFMMQRIAHQIDVQMFGAKHG